MANVRDSDTSLWLHNKLGTSNDSWISGSICSQLNKEVLRNIKECFPDLQTQVKQKLLLSFFHIPRRLVEEWKTELEEVIEVAGLDTELWVAMLAEMMKTFPATSSLNTEISDYEDTRPIFTDMVNDLRKLVSKHCDLGMLPLECQYLNKNALISVVGQQQNPVKHFTLKRKPKSANLRTELLHKSADAQSSLKKNSAPTIPLRSRGMPRKMTDTTPLKGIPSRVPTSGFRSPNVSTNQQRPNLSRTPAGRKDGGIKLIEFTEQPLGYAAAKKRKREQQLEEQQKKQEQKQQNAAAAAANNSSPTASPSQSGGAINATGVTAGTPTTPTSTNASFEIKTENSPHINLNNNTDENADGENKEISMAQGSAIPKSEPATPDYAPSLAYTQTTPTTALSIESTREDIKPKTIISTTTSGGNSVVVSKVTSTSVQTQSSHNNSNNNNISQAQKRIKQEIEIKSEEILVPAAIKVEKIEPQTQLQTQVTQPQQLQLQQTQMPRLQQRVIIQQQQQMPQQQQQQQPQTQHVLIRAAPQQKQQTVTLTNAASRQIAGTTIKMEKLDIKPLARGGAGVGVSATTNNSNATSTTILTPQQLRQVANPLANLPNNISVKITSTKAAKTLQSQPQLQQLQQSSQQQQQQQPILINSSTPVILASTPTQVARQKHLAAVVSAANTVTTPTRSIKSMPLSQLKTAANNGPVIISQTIIQPAKRAANSAAGNITQQSVQQQQQQLQQQVTAPAQQGTTTQYILTSTAPQSQSQQQQNTGIPTLTSFAQVRPAQQNSANTIYQTAVGAGSAGSTTTSTKILLKTSPTSGLMMTPVRQQAQQQTVGMGVAVGNPPPLIATSGGSQQQPTLLNIQNVQLPNRPVTIQPASQAAQQQHLQAQLQQQQQPQQHTIVSNTSATQQPKLTQVLMQPTVGAAGVNAATAANVKNKTIILTQKGVILRNIGGDMYQQIPISNVSGLQGLTTGTGATLMTTAAGPPSLVKTTASGMQQAQTIQLQPQKQQLPTLIPTNTITAPQHMIVQQQQTQPSLIAAPSTQTIIRPVMTNVQGGLTTLPQGLTLIQRPGQQPQLVQVQTAPAQQQQQQTQIQRTIITQPVAQQAQQQLRPQQIVLQHKPAQQRIITTTTSANAAAGVGQPQQIQIQQSGGNPSISRPTHIVQVAQAQQQTQTPQQPQRKGLSLSNEHVHKAHEMFRKANRVSRPDKALILGFMAGMRENPRPNSENVIVIKLGETEEKVQQDDGNTALCLVESLIRLDYNTGEWKTFQNYRVLDQNTPNQQSGDSSGTVLQSQNSVVI